MATGIQILGGVQLEGGSTISGAGPAAVTSNLVAYYNTQDSASYSGTGTTINSLATTNLPGTMTDITYTSPYFTYNGTSSQVSIADNALLEPGSGDWTMEAWVYLANSSGGKTVLGKFDQGGGSEDVSYAIRLSGANLFAQMGNGTVGINNYINSTSQTLTLNTWYQAVYVWKNIATNSLETYINGASIGSVAHSFSSLLNSTNSLYLGSYNGGEYSQYWNGRIGIVRLYNSALTGAEVLQNYNANRGIYGL